MNKTLVDRDVVGYLQVAELFDQKLQQSVAISLIQHNCHCQLIDVREDVGRATSLDRVFYDVQSTGLQSNSNSLKRKKHMMKLLIVVPRNVFPK